MADCYLCSKQVVDDYNPYPGCFYYRDTCEVCGKPVCNSPDCSISEINKSDLQRKVCQPCCRKYKLIEQLIRSESRIICKHEEIDRAIGEDKRSDLLFIGGDFNKSTVLCIRKSRIE